MKLKRIVMPFLILSLLLAACANNLNLDDYELQNHEAKNSNGDFAFRLVSEKNSYQKDEEIILYAEITYLGEQEQVEIVHASSPVFFDISEAERQINIEYTVQDIGITTTLLRDEPHRILYDKSNSFIDDEKFYNDFIELAGFPPGYYIVKGQTDFAVFEHVDDQSAQRYNIDATIDFKVTE